MMERLDCLAELSDTAEGLTRLYLSPAHRRAADQVAEWMRAAGMEVHFDAAASVVGRWNVPGGKLPLLLGSHIDTVRAAGRYDGAFGVVCAIEAVHQLRVQGWQPPCPIEIIAFGDEEGVRFPVTLTGARAVAGTFDAAALQSRDEDGISLAEALRGFGADPRGLQAGAARRQAGAYLEVHIEQGPVLEAADVPVGIVTAIAGASRFTARVCGEAGHAGTVPMTMRRDALVAACRMVLAVRAVAVEHGVVATVGMLQVTAGARNVIPADVSFSIDLRAAEDGTREAAASALRGTLHAIGAEEGVRLDLVRVHDMPATQCAAPVRQWLARSVAQCGIEPTFLPSGAGHDAMAVAASCPVGMLFVRCKDGISHHPAESVSMEDAAASLRVLLAALQSYDPDLQWT